MENLLLSNQLVKTFNLYHSFIWEMKKELMQGLTRKQNYMFVIIIKLNNQLIQ